MQAKTFKGYLIVTTRGDMRIAKTTKGLKSNEFAFALSITIPPSYWATVCGQITVELPTMETVPAIEVAVAKIG